MVLVVRQLAVPAGELAAAEAEQLQLLRRVDSAELGGKNQTGSWGGNRNISKSGGNEP